MDQDRRLFIQDHLQLPLRSVRLAKTISHGLDLLECFVEKKLGVAVEQGLVL